MANLKNPAVIPLSPQEIRQNTPPFTGYTDPAFKDAVLASSDLLSKIAGRKSKDADLARTEDAINLMFALHANTNKDGPPYVNHTTLVTRIVALKFQVTTPVTLTLATTHDSPEDEALKANKIILGKDSSDQNLSITAIATAYGKEHSSQLADCLSALTNPDFRVLAAALKNPSNYDVTQVESAKHLLKLAEYCPGTTNLDPSKIDARELWNHLYLGHFVEIIHRRDHASIVKLADSIVNAMHLHLVEPDHPKLSGWVKKYSPVVSFLEQDLKDNKMLWEEIISARGVRYVDNKIRCALSFSLEFAERKSTQY